MLKRALFAAAALSLAACAGAALSPQTSAKKTETYAPQPYVQVQHPEWAKDAILYQINTRQFTQDGTFKAAEAQLPRLKDLGVDILWLMPIHPIGEVNRKGTLGSPYSVKDYFGVNPEFGTEDDFRSFVDAAHEQGFHVILDWVANHSAWDNPIVEQHPDWYDRDWKGDFHPTPWTDWADIIDFDYNQPELRKYMTRALKYWVEEFNIDGYRADVAGFVPLDFWNQARSELNAIKPVFMLAEWEERDMHQHAFNATYAWKWKESAHRIAKGHSNAGDMTFYLQHHIATWPQDAYRMLYTENHDQNAWEGTTGEIFGASYRTFQTLSFVTEGIPLIHNGQEVGNQDALEFFEKDPIQWNGYTHPDGDFIKQLIFIRKANKALWNGSAGGRIVPIVTDKAGDILSFVREKDGNKVVVLANLSPRYVTFNLTDGPAAGSYTEALTNRAWTIDLADNAKLGLDPWGILVLVRNIAEDTE